MAPMHRFTAALHNAPAATKSARDPGCGAPSIIPMAIMRNSTKRVAAIAATVLKLPASDTANAMQHEDRLLERQRRELEGCESRGRRCRARKRDVGRLFANARERAQPADHEPADGSRESRFEMARGLADDHRDRHGEPGGDRVRPVEPRAGPLQRVG